jgi:hypothetical protein
MRAVVSVASVVAAVVVLSGCVSSHHGAAPQVSSSRSVASALPSTPTTSAPAPTLTTDAPPAAATASAATSPAAMMSLPTARVIVRPVTADGRPAPGYQVADERLGAFLCAGGASPVATGPNIRFCGDSATNTLACWDSAVPSTVLCLRDPLTRDLVRIKFDGSFSPIAAPGKPAPQALLLDNGLTCLIRNGGAWARPQAQPDWIGWYACRRGADDWNVDVYGLPTGNGIDESSPTWTVQTAAAAGTGAIVQRKVKIAYFVGTA